LLRSVKRFAEVKNFVGRVIASFLWRQIDGLLKIAVEECRFDVNLVAFKVKVVDQGEEDSDGVTVRRPAR
jgi:hypothetical protein